MMYAQNNDFTYVKNLYVDRNIFIGKKPVTCLLPRFEDIKDKLPKPVFDGHDSEINCYYKAWEIAFGNIANPNKESGFVSPFVDTAFNGDLFMWDSSFMMMFCKYAAHLFDFQGTLDNFYALQHADGFICREVSKETGLDIFSRFDPSSTGPNIMPWAEWEYYKFHGNAERIKSVFAPLLAYYEWMRENRTWKDGTYFSSGLGCGMDNMPRVEPQYNELFSTGHMVWLDVCCQQILSCNILAEMADMLGDKTKAAELIKESSVLSDTVNNMLWDNETEFYYDMYRNGSRSSIKTAAAYWALTAGIVPHERIDGFTAHLENEKEFKRPHRVPVLSADNPKYDGEGGYWKGSVWAPVNYMILKGLTGCGKNNLAYDIACNHLKNVTECFEKTGTLWENYAPEKAQPGNISKSDFIGWTGLVPIAVLIEYVLGIQVCKGKIVWNINRTERHGITGLTIGENRVDLLCEGRSSKNEIPKVKVSSDKPISVECHVNGKVFSVSELNYK